VPNASKAALWTGRVITGLVVLLLTFDSVTKLIREPHTIAAAAQMGIKADMIVTIGAILALCLIVYLIPRASLVGAVLLTGYLGGATATNMILGQSLMLCVFPVVCGVLVWLGLFLRDDRVRALIAPRGSLM
jgi:uncharacterized membrane protein (UPF0182 family)